MNTHNEQAQTQNDTHNVTHTITLTKTSVDSQDLEINNTEKLTMFM